MAQLTEKGLAKLETLRDYWPPKPHYSSVKMRQKYLLGEIEKNPEFLIEQHSILRRDWNRLKDQGLIVDTTVEPIYVVEGTDKVLYRSDLEKFIKVTRPSDAPYRMGQIVPKLSFYEMVEAVEKEGGEAPLGEELREGEELPESPEADWDRRPPHRDLDIEGKIP